MRMVLMFMLLITAAATATAQSSDTIANGKVLFDSKYRCYSCHGYEGHGGMGPRLGATKFPGEAFIAYVRHPRQMPAFSAKTIPDSDLQSIWSYLKSLSEPPKASDIPLLNELLKQQ